MAERSTAITSALVILAVLAVISGGFMFAMMLQQDEMTKLIKQNEDAIDKVVKEYTQVQTDIERAEGDVQDYEKKNEDLNDKFGDSKMRKDKRLQNWKEASRLVPGARGEVWTEAKEQDQRIDRAIKTVDDAIRSFEEAKKRLMGELANARKGLEAKKKQVKDIEEGFVKELSKKTHRLDELKAKIERIRKQQEAEKKVEADGRIVAVGAEETRYIAIDIGRIHGVTEDMKFSVFEEKRSGDKVVKGRIKVKDVRPTSCDCVLLPAPDEVPACPQCGWVAPKADMQNCVYCFLGDNDDEVQPLEKPRVVISAKADKMNPIMAGDFISNPYFTPGEVKTFVFGGETIFKSKREIKLFIEEHGGKLEDKLTVDTDYLIAGTGEEAESLLKRARDIGIKVMKEEELYRFFGEEAK